MHRIKRFAIPFPSWRGILSVLFSASAFVLLSSPTHSDTSSVSGNVFPSPVMAQPVKRCTISGLGGKFVTILRGGSRPIVISVSHHGEIAIWELQGAKAVLIKEIEVKGYIFGIEGEPNAQIFAVNRRTESAIRDWVEFIDVWDVAKLKRLYSLELPNYLTAWRMSPDGKYLAYLDHKSLIHIHETLSGKKVSSWRTGFFSQSMAFSPDGRFIATVPLEQKFVQVWDSSNGKKVRELVADGSISTVLNAVFRGNNSIVTSVHSHPLGQLSLMIWEFPSGKVLARATDDPLGVERLAINPVSGWLASSWGENLLIWNISPTYPLYRLKMERNISALSFSQDGRWLAATDSGKGGWMVCIWELIY